MSKKNSDSNNTPVALANSAQQKLVDHLYGVGLCAEHIFKTRYPGFQRLSEAALIAGLWHDIGKLDPFFKQWLTELVENILIQQVGGLDTDSLSSIDYDKHPRHHEISLALFELLSDPADFHYMAPLIAHGIFWHHAKPIRKKDSKLNTPQEILSVLKKRIGKREFNALLESAIAMMQSLYSRLGIGHRLKSTHDVSVLERAVPAFKYINDKFADFDELDIAIERQAKNSMIRSAVISADRFISGLSQQQLESYIASGSLLSQVDQHLSLKLNINGGSTLRLALEQSMQRFALQGDPVRNRVQATIAAKLADLDSVGVLNGPAGVGKTNIALQWAALGGVKKIIWVCPRVQVCLGVYKELSAEYLPTARIEIVSGDFKKTSVNAIETDTTEDQLFGGDVVITTIDQLISSITTHRHSDSLMSFIDAHVVIDEFHEVIQIPGFNLLLAELVKIKKMREQEVKLLLVSATINPLFCRRVLDIHSDDIIDVETFNHNNYHIAFERYDEQNQLSPLVVGEFPANTFVVTNSATHAQLGFILHQKAENAILLHSKFTKGDKRELFEKTYASFKQGGSGAFDVLRAGPIVQASLNISCTTMATDQCSPESWLQRLGRLNRFGEVSDAHYTTYLPNELKERQGVGYGLKQQYEYKKSQAWFEWLSTRLDTKAVCLHELYQLYRDFYSAPAHQALLESELLRLLEDGAQLLNAKVLDPRALPRKPQKHTAQLKAKSLRGDSRYVQMAQVMVDEQGNYQPMDSYVMHEQDEDSYYTLSLSDLEGYNDDNPIQFMVQKHKKIMESKGERVAKIRSIAKLIRLATSPSNPIYASYTDEDLQATQDRAHIKAVYYLQTPAQPVGSMCIEKHLIKGRV